MKKKAAERTYRKPILRVNISLFVTEEMQDRLRNAAEKTESSVSWIIRRAIASFLDHFESEMKGGGK